MMDDDIQKSSKKQFVKGFLLAASLALPTAIVALQSRFNVSLGPFNDVNAWVGTIIALPYILGFQMMEARYKLTTPLQLTVGSFLLVYGWCCFLSACIYYLGYRRFAGGFLGGSVFYAAAIVCDLAQSYGG